MDTAQLQCGQVQVVLRAVFCCELLLDDPQCRGFRHSRNPPFCEPVKSQSLTTLDAHLLLSTQT